MRELCFFTLDVLEDLLLGDVDFLEALANFLLPEGNELVE